MGARKGLTGYTPAGATMPKHTLKSRLKKKQPK
ncbi:hypothetical protein LCGC14_1509580, partial [marine sediment metagenome]